MEDRTFCPNCGRKNYYDPFYGEYMCTSVPCGKNYPKEIFEELMRIKSEGLDISFCANPKLSIMQLNLINRVLMSEINDGLEAGSRAKYLNNSDLLFEQQDLIYQGLCFERLFGLNPGEIVGTYFDKTINEMEEQLKRAYFKYRNGVIEKCGDTGGLMVIPEGYRKTPEEFERDSKRANAAIEELRAQREQNSAIPKRRRVFVPLYRK